MRSERFILSALLVIGLAAILTFAASATSPSAVQTSTPAGTPCVPIATPAPVVDACVAAGLGTPVSGDDLVVELTAASTKAGPIDLIVEIRDRAGTPVEDATVEIRTRHIEMDHGVSTDEAVHQGNGRYLAERVSMGMGGTWQAEIQIAREGRLVVVVTFVVTLSGLSH